MPGGRSESREGRAINRGIGNAKAEGKQYYTHGTKYGGGHVFSANTGKHVESGRRGDMVEKYGKK